MSIQEGTSLSHYRITAKLGEGGMGEVYRAEDTHLKRDVAIKVLPAALAGDPERIARLEREAQVLAALEHTNVASIYGLDEAEVDSAAIRFLVMQLAEGQTLADRLVAGPIPMDEALPIARQIAAGLEAAHEAGIVHRDLKPANIMLAADGAVKILDFGLAKAYEADGAAAAISPELTASPTSILATQAGVIMGTAAYMSPEQARGRPVDKRSDIWAFACVLYEMLAGAKTFSGETVTDVIAAIVTREPDFATLPGDTPAGVHALLERAFEKDPRERLRDIGEARVALEPARLADAGRTAAATETAQAEDAADDRVAAGGTAQPGFNWIWPAAILTAVLVTYLATAWLEPASPSNDVIRASIALPKGQELAFGTSARPNLTISSDGRTIAFVTMPVGAKQAFDDADLVAGMDTTLWLRELGDGEVRRVDGARGATQPVFAADGRWLAYLSSGWLTKVPVSGGAPERLAPIQNVWGVDWRRPDSIVVSWPRNSGEMLFEVPAIGGEGRTISSVANSNVTNVGDPQDHSFPFRVEDDEFLVTEWTGGLYEESNVAWLSVGEGELITLQPNGSNPAYIDSGHLVYAHGEQVFGVAFDLESRRVIGTPTLITDNVLNERTYGTPQVAAARTGVLLYAAGGDAMSATKVVWIDTEGNIEIILDDPVLSPQLLSLSPDGTRFAFPATGSGNVDIWSYDIGSQTPNRVTTEPSEQHTVIWGADRDSVIYADFLGQSGIYSRTIDGAAPQLLHTNSDTATPFDLSPDGRWLLLYTNTGEVGTYSVGAFDLETEGAEMVLLGEDGAIVVSARFSPDGRWVAYEQVRAGQLQTWLTPFPAAAGDLPVLVSQGLGAGPIFWSHTGRAIYFRRNSELWRAEITFEVRADGTMRVRPDEPELVIRTPDDKVFDVGPDGRFIAIRYPDVPPVTHLEIILNLGEYLRQNAPAQR